MDEFILTNTRDGENVKNKNISGWYHIVSRILMVHLYIVPQTYVFICNAGYVLE